MSTRRLNILEATKSHNFLVPSKRINEGHDVPFFLTSRAYSDIGIFIMQLNVAMCPRKSFSGAAQQSQLDDTLELSDPVQKLHDLLKKIDTFIEEAPPDTGPRRFGNVSFRKWYKILESRVKELLQNFLPREVLDFSVSSSSEASVLDELTPYLMGAFGSSQRLDYGTGHELSFLAFLACIWKLGGFTTNPSSDGGLERSIVLGVIEPYLRVVRRLILSYTLEPAGSHGVWGLDDHSFLPYIFGSSQYCPAINNEDPMPVEGALAGSPIPADIAKKNVVDRERERNMYFAAVGFINDVKTGPFWEHSPILFDISGVRSGWGKINKGMIKMYNAEVLSKFPVVQHFPFGSLFAWEQDPEAIAPASSVHTSSQPTNVSTGRPSQSTQVPRVNSTTRGIEGATKAPWAQSNTTSQSTSPPPMAPWVANGTAYNSRPGPPSSLGNNEPPTRAPWAKR